MANLNNQTEEALGWAAESEKYIDRDAEPAKEITFMDTAKFVAELTPVIGDAMAAKEVYDELQKDDPNYLLAGALGGAAIIGLIPGIGDAAAAAIKAGARKTLDVAKRVEIDPDAVGAMGGNIKLKPKEEVTPQLSNIEYQRKMAEFDKTETVDDWQKNVAEYVKKSRDVNPTIRTPELEKSTKDLLDNKITREQHLANVDKYKPVDPWDSLPREPSSKSTVFSLNAAQRKDGNFVLPDKAIKNLNVKKANLKVGDRFLGRLDIPAYKAFDTWIIAGKSPKGDAGTTYAKAIHYEGLEGKPVIFRASQVKGEKIGMGKADPAYTKDTHEKTGYATIDGIVKDLDVEEIRAKATQYLNDPEWTQVGFDPRRQGGFYVRAGENKHVPVREASEVIQIGPLVLAKNAKLDMDYTGFNEGGMAMSNQMQMNEGGAATDNQMVLAFMADDVEVDPVSGNEVPPGSLPEEVRDDIPAQLSEGEYVVPADVLRFYGMKFFEDLRENAKIELARMDREGRIGGQPVPANDNELTPEEMAELDAIGAAVGGFITGQPSQSTMPDPYQQQQMMYRQGAPVAMGNAGYAPGGTVTENDPTQAQFDFSKYQPGFSFTINPNVFQPVLMYKEGENPKYATTQEMYDQMLGDGWTTKLIQTTTETTVGEEPEVTDNDPGVVGSTDISSITDSMEDKDLDKTTKGLGLLADLSTALAGQLGIPLTALINTKAVAKYNDALTDQSKRKGSIFGGEGSIYEGLDDTDGKQGKTFGDTWLGDLLGFDTGGPGIEEGNPNLRDSFMGARRGFDVAQLEGTTPSSSTSTPSVDTRSPSERASDAQSDWMKATNAVKAAGNDHLARHKAIKAQSEASKKFTAAKKQETANKNAATPLSGEGPQ